MDLTLRIDKPFEQLLGGQRLQEVSLKVAQMAGRDAQRTMKTEATKHIRARKNIKLSSVQRLMSTPTRKQAKQIQWVVHVKGEVSPMIGYDPKKTKKGVTVRINKGGPRKLLPHAFIATMRSGHEGVFIRQGGYTQRRKVQGTRTFYGTKQRLDGGRVIGRVSFNVNSTSRQKIKELYTSRVVDPLLDKGEAEAIQERARQVFGDTWRRVLPFELGKATLAATRRGA